MKILLVPWALLLFRVSLNSGHYIREAEDGNSIYKVKEDTSGITFENPKHDEPTLREILYYHIIERPRDTPEEPAVTERSFTNGHSNFLDLAQLLEEYDEKDDNDDEHDGYLETDDEQHQLQDQDEEIHEEEPELTTQKPLTDQDVKEAYKARSYLFDQMRQRYSVKRMAVPDSLNRRKRQAEMESVPDAPGVSTDPASKEAYIQPKTYGMNLNSDGGYVWNNLNNPPTYYELGSSSGNPAEGSYDSSQSQENMPPLSENAYIPPVPESSDSGSSEDIFVVTNRPSSQPLETEAAYNPDLINENPEPINENTEPINENPEPINENLEAVNGNQEPINNNPELSNGGNYPVEPIIGTDSNDESESGFLNPIGSEVYENPGPVPLENPEVNAPQQDVVNEGSVGDMNENIYGSAQPEEATPDGSDGEGSEGEIIKEMPEAPTLAPLNYDNLPGYIRDAISSTEQPTSYEQTDNPYTIPQPNPEDKQVMQDNMEGILATAQPVEDIPKTYGMNLTSDGGHVWNDMINPPVSYDVGSPSQPEQEHKEEQKPVPTEQPEVNPIPEPAVPEKEEPIINPEEPDQEPEVHESEEAKPIEEPSIPDESEETIANPEPENEDKPIEEPAEQVETVEPEPENPELVPEPGNEDMEQSSEEPAAEIPEKENKKPDIMSELLKSEQFWKWLGEWTATYMELLEKHIRKIAIQEICNREKGGEQMCLLDGQPEEEGVVIKDGKIVVDGKEIDVTHRDNLDKDLKRGHQNNKGDNDKKNKNENKVEASTIYGNSVGNEKVTNVFIFTADKADEVIDKLKPTNDFDIDFIIDDRIKEENKDEKIEEKSTEVATDPEETNAGVIEEEANAGGVSTEDASNAEAIEGEANKEEGNNEQISESESNKEESENKETIKEELAEIESKEEPKNEEANNEDINKKESNENESIKEESNKNDSSQGNQDSSKSSENKEPTSGDIDGSEQEDIEESKLKPSESES